MPAAAGLFLPDVILLFVSLGVGFLASCLIGVVAYRRRALARSGVIGAVLTGTAIFGFGGFVPGLLLTAFFISSSFLSHYKASNKAQLIEKFQKGSQRDLGQALANGGWAAVLAIGAWLVKNNGGNPGMELVLLVGLIGALATVTADTWATEIGALSAAPPRLITTRRVVPPGTSGGVTPLGILTSVGGGIFIGVMVLIGVFILYALHFLPGLSLNPDTATLTNAVQPYAGWLVILLGALSGLIGSLFDSLAGASVQAIYFCEYDEAQTERKTHSCGRATRLVRGWRWLDNDGVNFLASVVGSGVAMALAAVLFG